jgi:hypothetical protein
MRVAALSLSVMISATWVFGFPTEIKALLPTALMDEFRSPLIEKIKDIRSNYPYIVRKDHISFFADTENCPSERPNTDAFFEIQFLTHLNSSKTEKSIQVFFKKCGRSLAHEVVTVRGEKLHSPDPNWKERWLAGQLDFELSPGESSKTYSLEYEERPILKVQISGNVARSQAQFYSGTGLLFEVVQEQSSQSVVAKYERVTEHFSAKLRKATGPQIPVVEFAYTPELTTRRSFKEWKDRLTSSILEPYWNNPVKARLRGEVLVGFPKTERVVSLARNQKLLDEFQLIRQQLRSGDPSQVRDAEIRVTKILTEIEAGKIVIDDRRE